MAKIRLLIELDYDEKSMHEDEPGAIEWFFKDVLKEDLLFLHSNFIGDTVGTVKVLQVENPYNNNFQPELKSCSVIECTEPDK